MSELDRVERRRIAHETLDRFFDTQERLFENAEDDDSREGWARVLMGQAADLASFFAGSDLIDAALTPSNPAESREATLERIIERLCIASMIFGSNDSGDPASLWEAAAELRAICAGDEPQLFAKVAVRKVNYRQGLCRLRALEWDVWLEEIGMAPSDRHSAIASAFGQEWDTISRWEKSMRSVLSDKVVDDRLRHARLAGERGSAFWVGDADNWREQVKHDGRAYKSAMGFSVVRSEANHPTLPEANGPKLPDGN